MLPSPKTKKILFWFGLSLPMVALLAMAWLVHQTGGRFNSSFTYVMQNYKVLDIFERTQAQIVDAEAGQRGTLPADDIDAFLSGDASADANVLKQLIVAVAQNELTPAVTAQGFTDFQLTRGLLGVST